MDSDRPPVAIEFYESPDGDKPVLRWISEELTVARRRTLGYALWRVLQHMGVGVCGTEFGRQLGGGLFEFRVRAVPSGESAPVILRVFCHATGRKHRLAPRRLRQGRRSHPQASTARDRPRTTPPH